MIRIVLQWPSGREEIELPVVPNLDDRLVLPTIVLSRAVTAVVLSSR